MDTPLTPSAPEIAPVSSEPTPAPTPSPVAATPPLSEREQIYQKYYGSPEPEVVTPPTPEVVPPTPEPVVASDPPPAPALTGNEELFAAIAALKDQVAALTPKAPAPTPEVPVVNDTDWMAAMASGNKDLAEQILKSRMAPEIAQHTVTQVLETIRVQNEINTFITDLRGKNADIIDAEEWITYKAQQGLQKLRDAGSIQNNDDYIKHYKDEVNKAVASVRTTLQRSRAAGKEEGFTRTKEVLSSTPLSPSAIDPNRGNLAPPAQPAFETAEDYFAKRKARTAANLGLS